MQPETYSNTLIPASSALRILTLANEALEIGDRNAGIQHALAGICELLGADTSFLFVFDSPDIATPQLGVMHGYTPERAPQVLARYASLGDGFDTLAQRVRAAYDGKAAVLARRRQELITDRDWYNSAYVNEFRREWGFDHSIYSIQRVGQQRVGMSVNRAFGGAAFSAEDRALIEIFHLAISRAVSRPLTGKYQPFSQACRASLAPRARETLDCLLRGASNKTIGEQLGLSPNTVHHYCKQVFRAFGVRSRGELIARWFAGSGP
jgi:DNA-binding CsgD family transcriptional regulator